MKGQNFVRTHDDVLAAETCFKIIEEYELYEKNGYTVTRQMVSGISRQKKQDTSAMHSEMLLSNYSNTVFMDKVSEKLSGYLNDFEAGMFGAMPETAMDYPVSQSGVKIQKTLPSQGYHIWHGENTALAMKGRVLTWILYLNDVQEGGETELLHLSERIQPKMGRLTIFPASWTHTHRGNPPLSGVKYILTGWMEYTQ